tara:strand:+ start:27225 stop:27608 length:384 start_codon:yes stop_codon:yes gene_type:complete
MDTKQAVVAVKGGTPERRYRTNAEKRRIVEEALAGDASVARRNGVNANLLFNWRKLYREGLLDQCREPTSATLVPVRVTPTPPSRVGLPTAGLGHIEIELSGEIRLRVHGPVDGQTLADVLAALGHR